MEGAQTALLVQDVQNAHIDIAFGASVKGKEYLEKLSRTIELARRGGTKIIYVVACFRPGYPEVHPNNSMLSRVPASGKFVEGDDSSQIHPSVSPAQGDVVITKRRVSSFAGTDLEIVLRSLGIRHLVLLGLSTSGVVLSTVRQAADLDFEITVLEDLCADMDVEVHEVLIQKIFPRQGKVLKASEWLAPLKN